MIAEKQSQETHQLSIMPIGAGREVGRSCIIMQYQGKTIMFDCGIHMNRSHKGKNALPYFEKIRPQELDIILITHFHLDHCGALPYFLKNYNFKGKIYMTRPTKEIYALVLRDSIKVKSENLDQDLINELSIEQSLKNIELIDYNQEINHKGIKIKCYNAGHVLGAAMFMVEIDGIRVLYTGDYSTENERHLRPAQIPNEKIHVLICESTYGDSLHESREQREAMLITEIFKTLRSGGNVLLPVFATGRCHELLLILDEYWQKQPDIQQFPIFSTCTLAQKCINIFQKYINKLGERIFNRFIRGENLFNFKHIQVKKDLKEVLQNPYPKVVMVSPGLLQSGYSKQLFELWCQDPKNQVIVTGQAVQDTIAHKLVNNNLQRYTIPNEGEVDVKIRALSISFSAHADYLQTSTFISSLKPQHIVLVHGTEQKCKDLANKININFKGIISEVWTPANQSEVLLTFERSNINQVGCKAIGKLAEELEQFNITFRKEHQAHLQNFTISNNPNTIQEECLCCSSDMNYDGYLLNTEHGFILCSENDKEALNSFGIQQNYLLNSMYVPFTGSLEQVYNLVKKVQSQNEIEYLPEDLKIIVKSQLEICVPLSSQATFLQFKWQSNVDTDQLADSLAFLITKITPSELHDIERGRQKRQGLISILNSSGFPSEMDENTDDISIKYQGQVIAKGDLQQIEFIPDVEVIIQQRLQKIYNSFINL